MGVLCGLCAGENSLLALLTARSQPLAPEGLRGCLCAVKVTGQNSLAPQTAKGGAPSSSVIHYKLGFKKFDFHSLRHTHATMLCENGAQPKYVQKRLGHKNIQVTLDIYTHVSETMNEHGRAVLNSMYDAAEIEEFNKKKAQR